MARIRSATPRSSQGSAFAMPTLKEGVKATLDSRYFSDLDLVPVKGPVPVEGRNINAMDKKI